MEVIPLCPTSLFPPICPEFAAPWRSGLKLRGLSMHWWRSCFAVQARFHRGERELIATYVSSRNSTEYCHNIHGAIAAAHLGGNEELVRQVKVDYKQAEISPKLKTLLAIAGKVQQDGKLVTAADVDAARKEGATDLEIHDTVLIAAAFCMYNRYVDGLGTIQPADPAFYHDRGARVARDGYAAVSEEYLDAHAPAVS